jgi:hypothetical protein
MDDYRGGSSVGRALRSQCRGRGFNSPPLHTPQPVDSPCQRVVLFDSPPDTAPLCITIIGNVTAREFAELRSLFRGRD